MSKVSLDTIKPWISNRITQILGIEDDVVVEFIFNMLENDQVGGVVCLRVTRRGGCCLRVTWYD